MTGKTRDIAAGASKTGNESAADRIADANEHDWHTSRNWLERRCRKVGVCHCDIGRTGNDFGGPEPHLLRLVVPPLHLHNQVAILSPPQLVEPAQEGGEPAP